jgi:hypothetical protein
MEITTLSTPNRKKLQVGFALIIVHALVIYRPGLGWLSYALLFLVEQTLLLSLIRILRMNTPNKVLLTAFVYVPVTASMLTHIWIGANSILGMR